MTAKDFFIKVEKMRDAQKKYFKTRSSYYLKESKRLEKEIDTEIERVNKIICDDALSGRKFIGIDASKEYCNIARKRLKPLFLQTKLF